MQKGTLKYQAAAGNNVVVSSKPAVLHGIIIGADVSSSVIEISDHASDGDGNIKIKLTGATLMTANGGYVKVEAIFNAGICADITNQTDITFIWSPA